MGSQVHQGDAMECSLVGASIGGTHKGWRPGPRMRVCWGGGQDRGDQRFPGLTGS